MYFTNQQFKRPWDEIKQNLQIKVRDKEVNTRTGSTTGTGASPGIIHLEPRRKWLPIFMHLKRISRVTSTP